MNRRFADFLDKLAGADRTDLAESGSNVETSQREAAKLLGSEAAKQSVELGFEFADLQVTPPHNSENQL